jgi:hypothetical protein
MMPVVVRTEVAPATLLELERAVAKLQTLADVVHFGLALAPPQMIAAVVVEDEYTHDVVLGWKPGLHLVFDAT